ncbi:MAG TPA: DUF4178 domain-containing protein [Verrucomicrobiae bacterium]|jgi:hypothetical protein|nr:DUF4178 domain-containing protein [Verrucomicrobiae bacterium]
MSLGNPTQIKLGMTGTFFKRTYRVIGRAVLGVIEGGQAYYWNEFYLESAGSGPATLVFEETETGYAWRLFTMFDPPSPITAVEAAQKHVGDVVDLDGAKFHITRVDRSQVYRVEGKTPQGIELNKQANYFNAEAASRLLVVSWTGNEVEFYSGMTTAASLVASAFDLDGFAAWRFTASSGRSWLSTQIWMPGVLVLALVCIPMACFIDLSRSERAPPVRINKAPVSPLRVGASGVLNGVEYKITGHELVEVAEVGWRRQCHEYDLSGFDNNEARLAYDVGSNGPVWLFYTALQPENPLTPLAAGGMKAGQSVQVDGSVVPIRKLFRATVRSSEGVSPGGIKVGDMFYGFSGGMSSNAVLVVRWNQTNIVYEQGMPVQTKMVLAAFGQPTGNHTTP